MTESDTSWTARYLEGVDEDGYVSFNKDRRLGQNQYASRYTDGRVGSPNLGADLRWRNLDRGDYHFIRIHRDDLLTFHARVKAYQQDANRGETKDIAHYLAITAKP